MSERKKQQILGSWPVFIPTATLRSDAVPTAVEMLQMGPSGSRLPCVPPREGTRSK